ncbi:xylosyl- and glucuronyltransferase LARGE2s-like [Anthonomus grandis grandis]|uniref:xylosyl- and glucuronyltransferase LARGE2s-like n=1 Tax=Anthonomus grandis grandis TaxID=2921223 RepID=UPI002165845C|nr:xylosyl- and glucuronyltransferase LARGE2s-like [Anthonomus grandis grandis]XP_050296690.1 xylosyl- and glucuronyltransferase LARGE2s-like [Anthonomus grandis grandis]
MFSSHKEKQEKIGFKRRNGISSRFIRSWLIVWIIIITIGTIIYYLQDHKGNSAPHSLRHFAKELNQHAKPTSATSRNFCEVIHIGLVIAGYKSNVYFHALLKSLFMTRSNPIHFHLLVTNDSDTVLRLMFDTWKVPQVNLTYYNLNPWLKHVRWVPNGHYSGNYGLLKLIFNKVIPASVTTKLLILDTDIIVNDDIFYLWKFFEEFNQKQAIGIGENQSPYYTGQLNQARPWPAIGNGFNSGVMLYDLEKLNVREWDDTWMDLTKRYTLIYGETDLGDQDIINSVIVENPTMAYKLPCYWNTQMSGYSTSSSCYSKYKPKILHWNSPQKFSVGTKDGDLFRGIANMIFEVNGNWFRDFPRLCPNDLQAPFSNIQKDDCETYIKSPDTTYRTLLFFMEHKFITDNWDITWVTHMSYDRVNLMENVAKYWTGPISFTLYVTDEELVKCMKLIAGSEILNRRTDIAYHAVFRQGEFYPINVLRNTGLKHAKTPYSFIVDADFRPMKSLYEILKDNISSMGNLTKKALVIPAFEATKPKIELPESKIQLLESLRKKEVQQFLVETWGQGHGPTDYNKWIEEYEPYKVKWQLHYEPYIVVKSDVVPYDERFLGFGWNKVSHIMELEAQNYEFVVLSDVFILHEPHGTSFDNKQYQNSPEYRKCVQTLKRRFIADLSKKYNRNFTDPTSDYLVRKKREIPKESTTSVYDSTDHFLVWGGKEKAEMKKETRKKHFRKEEGPPLAEDYVYYDAKTTEEEKVKSSEEHDYEYNEEERKFKMSHDSTTTVTFNDAVTILNEADLVLHETDESENPKKDE